MLVFIEGVDGTGKTTLCDQLTKHCSIIQLNVLRTDPKAIYKYDNLKDISSILNIPVILDRSFISDMVYRINDDELRGTVDLMNIASILENSKIIYCKTPKSYEISMQRGEDNITTKQMHNKIKETYEIIMRMLSKFANVKIMEYDFTKQNVNDVINFIQGGECDGIR